MERNQKKWNKKSNKRMFLKIWLRLAVPILAVTIVALYLVGNLVLGSMELLQGGSRLETIGTEIAWSLSGRDLTEKSAAETLLDLSMFHMVGILFDPEGREVARTDFYDDAEDSEMIARYQQMEETILNVHTEKSILPNNQVNAFDYNYWYEKRSVPTPQGEYTLYCAGVTATWPEHRNALVCLGMAILATVAVLTLLIAGSYYKIHKKQQAMEAAYSQRVNNLAHNLKTPMMVISGYSENFLAEIQTEKKTHYVERILENVNKMNAIVEEMLEFTGSTKFET